MKMGKPYPYASTRQINRDRKKASKLAYREWLNRSLDDYLRETAYGPHRPSQFEVWKAKQGPDSAYAMVSLDYVHAD